MYCKTNAAGARYVTDGEATIDQNGGAAWAPTRFDGGGGREMFSGLLD